MSNDHDLEVQLQALNAMFASKLGGRFLKIDEALHNCMVDLQNHDAMTELNRQLHSLAGSAGTFGFDALGMKAREIEGQVTLLLGAGTWTSQDLKLIAADLVGLKRLAPGQPMTT